MNTSFFIIDDDSINNLVCESIIRKHFNTQQVQSFISAEEALDAFKDIQLGNSNIILLDINMPEMDGWDFIKFFTSLKSDWHQHTRIFMLSSSIDQKDVDKSDSYDCVLGYVTKPLNKEKLVDAIEKTTLALQ